MPNKDAPLKETLTRLGGKGHSQVKGPNPILGLKTHQNPPTPGLDLEFLQSPPWKSVPGKLCPARNHVQSLSVSCSLSCCFLPGQRQLPSCVLIHKSIVWYLLCSMTLWNSLSPNHQDNFPSRAITLAWGNLSPQSFLL